MDNPNKINKKNGTIKMIAGAVAFGLGVLIKFGLLPMAGAVLFLYGVFQYFDKGNVTELRTHNGIMWRLMFVLLVIGLGFIAYVIHGLSQW
jgi:hypothetical protein